MGFFNVLMYIHMFRFLTYKEDEVQNKWRVAKISSQNNCHKLGLTNKIGIWKYDLGIKKLR